MNLLRLLALVVITVVRFDDSQAKAYHHIQQETRLEADSCTAEAVGPHALLTATHCELGTDQVLVDGTAYLISAKIRDGQDHTIYVLPSANFADYLQFANREPQPGERVRAWGWPGNRKDAAYKEGTFEGASTDEFTEWSFNLPALPGDSGGAIIDDSGKILSVVSMSDVKANCIGLPIRFTEAQLALTR